jgi:glycosyltransferase involved in cell wall biosynthesis
VITVTYNPGDSIIKTIQSIVSLKTDDVEFILMDGGSDQKSISLLEPFLQFYDVFITEKDKGIYDAMNKAWDIAKGKYIIFINDGDMLIDLPLEILRTSIFPVLSFPVKLSSGSVFKPEIGFPIHFKNTLKKKQAAFPQGGRLITKFDEKWKTLCIKNMEKNI